MSLTIFAQTFGTYQGNAHSAVLRIYCNQNFESTDSTMHSLGAVGSNSYFYSLGCTITDGSINVPQFGHPLPIDTDVATTVFTAGIYTRNGQLITTVLANYRLDSNMLPSTNWNAIKLFSDDNNIRISGDVYTKQQVDELLSQIVVSGVTDGDKGDITATSFGNVWTINDASVINAKIAAGIDAIKIAGGSVNNTAFSFLSNVTSDIQAQINAKQAALIAGTNIKTINGVSPLGSGDLSTIRSLSTLYSNSLATAISSIGSTKTTLLVDADATVSSATTIPSTLVLTFANGAKLTKSASGTIAFQGIGVTDPESQSPIFSGFNAGDITWTGSTWPARINSSLWDNAAWSTRVEAADMALSGKQAVIITDPGNWTAQGRVRSGHLLYMRRGSYTDNTSSLTLPRFVVESNAGIIGDGMGQTIWNQSTVTFARAFAYSSGQIDYVGGDGPNENIIFANFSIVGDLAAVNVDNGSQVISFGNTVHGLATGIHLRNVQGYGIYSGAAPTLGYYADDIKVLGCTFDGVRGQNTGTVNGKDHLWASNIFKNIQPVAADGLIAVFDLEMNVATDVIDHMAIIGNMIDGTTALQNWNAIVCQTAGGSANQLNEGIIVDNEILGGTHLSNGIALTGTKNYFVANNKIKTAQQAGISVSNSDRAFIRNNVLRECGGGGSAAMTLGSTSNSQVDNNIFDELAGGGAFSTDVRILEGEASTTVNTSTTGNTVVRTTGGTDFLPHWVGKTVTINSVDYVVATVVDGGNLTLTTNPGNQTGVTLTTKFSSNEYTLNDPVSYSLAGTSSVKSARDRVVRDALAINIPSDVDNLQPVRFIYRLDLTASGASRNITGLTWNAFPLYRAPVDGEEHFLRNAGASNNLTLKNESGSSTAANRFTSSTGADITLLPGQAAQVIYNSGTSRWLTFPLGGVTYPLLASDGTKAAPAYSFATNSNDGLFHRVAGTLMLGVSGNEAAHLNWNAGTPYFAVGSTGEYRLSSGALDSVAPDVGYGRVTASVAKITDGSTGAVGWLQTQGNKRVATNVTNATATMANITDLSITVAAGRKYSGRFVFVANNSTAAEGIAFDFNGGSSTWTSVQFLIKYSPPGVTLGVVTSSAIGTALTATTATTTDVAYEVFFTGVCNAGGTLIPRVAEVSHTSGTATVKAGSISEISDIP